MTKKQLEELVDKTGSLVGSKNISPKYGNHYIGSYDTTDDHVEKTTQDRSYETPYRRYFGEDDLSNHPLFDISQKAKTYDQFITMSKKYKPKMDDEELKDAAKLFGYRKDKKRIVKEKLTEDSLPINLIPGEIYKYKGKLTLGKYAGEISTGKMKFTGKITDDMYEFIVISMDNVHSNKRPGERFLTSKEGLKYFTPENINEENAKSLLEKIVKIKTKEDILPKKMVKSNNYIDKALNHLKDSMEVIEKYKDNPKASGIYKSLDKTIKSLEKIVDKIEDKTDLMDSINESSMKDELSPMGKESYKNLFGSKDTNIEFKKGYEKGYNDGYLDAKSDVKYDNEYSWDKYSEKNKKNG